MRDDGYTKEEKEKRKENGVLCYHSRNVGRGGVANHHIKVRVDCENLREKVEELIFAAVGDLVSRKYGGEIGDDTPELDDDSVCCDFVVAGSYHYDEFGGIETDEDRVDLSERMAMNAITKACEERKGFVINLADFLSVNDVSVETEIDPEE